jgi:ABC-2 type transport system permease protein
MSYRRLRAVFIKELHHITRDPLSLGMALAVPVMMLVLFGYALSLDVDQIPALIYDQSKTEASRDLIQQFQASRYFEIIGFVGDYAAIERGIDTGKALMGVVIPLDYSRNAGLGGNAPVQILFDGSDSNTASIALGYAQTVVQTYATQLRSNAQVRKGGQPMRAVVDPRIRVWYNSDLKSKNFIVPGLIAVTMMIIASMLSSLTIAREWENGTMEQLLSTPVRPRELVLGKLIAYFALGITDMLICVIVGVFIFQVPFRGSVWFLFFTSCLFLFGALSWGIFISATARTQLLAFQMGMLSSFLPGYLLSGFIYSIQNMPKAIQLISAIVPARYFVTILNGIFLKGVGIRILWGEVSMLIVYASLVFVAASRKLKQKVA